MDKRWIRLLKQQIKTAEVELVANIGTANVTFGDLMSMKAGDVIPLNVPNPVVATVDSVPVMECSYGKLNGQYALRIEKLILSANESLRGHESLRRLKEAGSFAEGDSPKNNVASQGEQNG
jgi:flagellar motor switch protein FliM